MSARSSARWMFLGALIALMAAFLFTPLGQWVDFERLAGSRDLLIASAQARPLLSRLLFFISCVIASALCFPVMPIIGLAAGAIFGFWNGLAMVSFASSIGSTFAFLGSRYLFRDWISEKFGPKFSMIDRGFERHGAIYMLALRFNPVIPYWFTNLAMGVTNMRVPAYYPLTIIGMLPATLIYVSAGTQLTMMNGIGDILSIPMIALLLALSAFPLLMLGVTRITRIGE